MIDILKNNNPYKSIISFLFMTKGRNSKDGLADRTAEMMKVALEQANKGDVEQTMFFVDEATTMLKRSKESCSPEEYEKAREEYNSAIADISWHTGRWGSKFIPPYLSKV